MRSGGSCAAVRTWPVAWPPAPQPTGGSVGPALMGGGGSRANALCGCGWYLVDLAPRADGFRSTASSATPLGGRDANRVVHLPLELLLASAAVAVGSDGAVWRATLRRQGPANQLERANPARTAGRSRVDQLRLIRSRSGSFTASASDRSAATTARVVVADGGSASVHERGKFCGGDCPSKLAR